MSFEQTLRIPHERIGVIIGRQGKTRKFLEERLGVSIAVDSKEGTVSVSSNSIDSDPFVAVRIVEAIGRGFSPQRAIRLAEKDMTLEIIDLREYAGKSENTLERIRGRIIGLNGKSRRVIEELTGCYISVYGRTVSIIGNVSDIKLASEAVRMLASGSMHKKVYNMLQRERAKRKLEKMVLWEGETIEKIESRMRNFST